MCYGRSSISSRRWLRGAASERNRLVDVAKGISIVLVAFAHSYLVPMNAVAAGINHGAGLVRMPFFFLLSGVFFSPSKPFGTLLREKSAALLKPYGVTLGFVVLTRVLVDGTPLSGELARMMYGVGTSIDMPWAPMWYLPHLWVVFPYAWCLIKITTVIALPVWSTVALLAGQTLVGTSYLHLFQDLSIRGLPAPLHGLPLSVDLLCISSTYFVLGYAVRARVLRFRPNASLVVLFLLVFAGSSGAFHPQMTMNQRIVVHPLATMACSLAGIYLALAAAHAATSSERLAAICTFFGSNAIFVLIFHTPIEAICRRGVSHLMSWQPGLGTAGTAFLTSVVCSAALGALIRRTPYLSALYLPRTHAHPEPSVVSVSFRTDAPETATGIVDAAERQR